MKWFREESGQTLILTALCMTCFMGFMALAIDVGLLFNARRKLQTAADAAATAAALRYLSLYDANNANQSTEITTANQAGQDAGQLNAPEATFAVSVNTNAGSPSAHRGCVATNCYFEAIATETNPTTFYGTFFSLWQGQSASPFTVKARAVAGTPNASDFCIYLTNETGSAYDANGKYRINASTCGIYVNSKSSSAMTGKGNSGLVDVTKVAAVGSTSGYTVNFATNTQVVGGVTPSTIPFSWITKPTPTGCKAPSGGVLTGNVSPGCYSGNVAIQDVVMQPGLYVFTGNVSIKNSNVTGNGVTLDIDSGSFTMDPGNGTLSLTAPGSGDGTNGTGIGGVVIYQPPSNSHGLSLQAGRSTMTLTGFIYAPKSQVSVQDNGGSTTVGGLVVDSISSGPSPINVAGYTPSTSALKVVTLVE
ncbi:TadE/TadG family type IV pilus assembly protein [Occallatibacter savannae]|uniref:TadE/TadG family type IV pilus assembly protein n=1 Tax=Occallatibacter savannae TaxID=1002691 RepID=UPI000D68E5BB|nr:Tad domain-containing protein [Occallatibacter savannae]